MVSRAKKPVFTFKNRPINNHDSWSDRMLKSAWGLCKRAWQMPFVWSLTFYLYWALRDIFVWNKSLWEGNYWNYVGITVSVAALVAKTPPARMAINATIALGAQLGTTFRRIPCQRVQIELHRASVLAGTKIRMWSKKATFSTVSNAVSGLKRVSVHAGATIYARIKATLVSESTQTVPGFDAENPTLFKRIKHRSLQIRERLPVLAQKRASSIQPLQELPIDAASPYIDGVLPENRVFDETSMRCLVCSHLIECFCLENKYSPSESKHHIATRCRFPKEPQSVEIIA